MNVIVGSLIAARYVETDWSLSFIYPGLIIAVVGFIIFLFLVVTPNDVGCALPNTDPINAHRVCPKTEPIYLGPIILI